MGTTAISGLTGTSAATATESVPSGTTYNYACYGLGVGETVAFQGSDSAGSTYTTLKYEKDAARVGEAVLNNNRSTLAITGPVDLQISKSDTASSTEVVRYT